MRQLLALAFVAMLLASPTAARADYPTLGSVMKGFADDPEVHDPMAQGYALALLRATIVLCAPPSDPDMVPILGDCVKEMRTKISVTPELSDTEPMTGVLMFLNARYRLAASCLDNYFG